VLCPLCGLWLEFAGELDDHLTRVHEGEEEGGSARGLRPPEERLPFNREPGS
jgi:hypothetical protein